MREFAILWLLRQNEMSPGATEHRGPNHATLLPVFPVRCGRGGQSPFSPPTIAAMVPAKMGTVPVLLPSRRRGNAHRSIGRPRGKDLCQRRPGARRPISTTRRRDRRSRQQRRRRGSQTDRDVRRRSAAHDGAETAGDESRSLAAAALGILQAQSAGGPKRLARGDDRADRAARSHSTNGVIASFRCRPTTA